MNIKNTIIEHYKNFFDLHAKGIALDEDDHLNLDWAEDLVKNCFILDVVGRSEQLKAFADYAQKRMWEDGDKDLSEFVDEFLRL